VERKVAFVVAGTQKGGTSALSAYMNEHLGIGMARMKEVHFFDDDAHFAGGAPNYNVYHANYEGVAAHQLLGDATPGYMYWLTAPARLAHYNPALKIIMILRNPVQRAFSHWNMTTRQGRETLSFDDALRAEPERARQAAPGQTRPWSYVDRGRYCVQLRRVWQHFPREQTLVLRSDTFRTDPAPQLALVESFLGIGPFPRTTPAEVFAAPYKEKMSDAARAFLHQAFADEIAELETLLGWDLGAWREAAGA
jgi:hypothetical protein